MNKVIQIIFKTFLLSVLVAGQVNFSYAQTASILPPAKTTFFDNNGKPLVSGKVQFYIPGTTTAKTTWQDSGETIPNTNPVVLDGSGRAIILGDGSYRQQVFDRNNNLIWDQQTSSTGTSGGGTTPTVGDGDAVGTVKPWAGFVAPSAYVFSYGQELPRASFPALFAVITSQQNVGCTSGSPTLTGLGDTSQIPIGAPIESICFNVGTTVISKTISTVTGSTNAIVSTTTSARFFPFGNGDGSSTFNTPDLRGRVLAGRDNMGGVAASRLTTTYFGANASAIGATGGNQSTTLVTGNLPPYTPAGTNGTVTVTSTSSQIQTNTSGTFTPPGGGTNSVAVANGNPVTSTGSGPAFTGTAQGGTSTPIATVQPTETLNWIIKTTPDSNPNSFFGVASIGGMTGILTCGTGITCAGNQISAISSAPAAGGANTQLQYNNSGALAGVIGAISNGTFVTLSAPSIDTSIAWLFSGTSTGTESIGDPSATSPLGSYVTTWQGVTAGGTTSLHILPASGTLNTNTTTEVVIGATTAQAFGGNYGRWSFSNFNPLLSGIVGEYGGTTSVANFTFQMGVENPPGTFASYEFIRLQTTSTGSEDSQVGSVGFGENQPTPSAQQNRIVLIKPSIGSAGHRNSDAVLWEGKANAGTDLAVWWRQYVNVTTNAGASCLNFDNNLNGTSGSYVNNATLCDTGIFNARVGLTIGGVAIPSSVSNSDSTLTISPTTGAIVASLNLAHANHFTGLQTFVGVTTTSNPTSGDVGEFRSVNCGANSATVTISIASPAVITWTGHPFLNTASEIDACPIKFTTTGALPTGIVAGTTYWIDPASIIAGTSFRIATTVANALAGTDITTTGTQSGTQTGTNLVSDFVNNAANNVTGLSLSAGDWQCSGNLFDNPAGTTVVTQLTMAFNTASATLPGVPNGGGYGAQAFSATGVARVVNISERFLTASPITVFIIEQPTFTTSTEGSLASFIGCRRMR